MQKFELIFVKATQFHPEHKDPMLRLIHLFCGMFLALALMLGGAVAMPISGDKNLTQMVICGETGAETIWIDASGTPVKAPHDCDICLKCNAFNDATDKPRGFVQIWRLPRLMAVILPSTPILPQPHAQMHPDPRGPPAALAGKARRRTTLTPLRQAAPEVLELCQAYGTQPLPSAWQSAEDTRS